jgi:hypothetical protein
MLHQTTLFHFSVTKDSTNNTHNVVRLRLKCDGIRAETRFCLWQNRWVNLNWRGRQFSQLLATKMCAWVVVMLDTPCSEVVWRVLATHSIRQFPLCFPSHALPCAITFQLDSTWVLQLFFFWGGGLHFMLFCPTLWFPGMKTVKQGLFSICIYITTNKI